uniref:Uncharacterized protein n=1 Tax=Cohnella candidum TaxID=2674991 RepID=A0A3G3JTC4_9BACL|nr:hypothetical protein EAV92_01885 [Cohnella candidum]
MATGFLTAAFFAGVFFVAAFFAAVFAVLFWRDLTGSFFLLSVSAALILNLSFRLQASAWRINACLDVNRW